MNNVNIFNIKPIGVASLLVLISAGVLTSVYLSQYWGGLKPCNLCIYQRVAWWIVCGLGLLAFGFAQYPRLWSALVYLCGLILVVGGSVAAYHVGIEQHWWPGPASCTGGGVMPTSLEDLKARNLDAPVALCDQVSWSLFGISMAGYNTILSFLAGFASFTAAWFVRVRKSYE